MIISGSVLIVRRKKLQRRGGLPGGTEKGHRFNYPLFYGVTFSVLMLVVLPLLSIALILTAIWSGIPALFKAIKNFNKDFPTSGYEYGETVKALYNTAGLDKDFNVPSFYEILNTNNL